MKKKYLNLLVLFSFIIGLIPLASCSDNDDEESGNGENNSGIVGTWKTVVNPAKRNVLDLKNETCKNREKRNVQKNRTHDTSTQ